MNKQEIIQMAREAGFDIDSNQFMAGMHAYADGCITEELMRFAELATAKEREARKASQLETIALREELTKRAMLAEKEAYQRGVRDEREACAKLAASTICDTHTPTGINIYGTRVATAIRARNNKDNQE